MSGHFAFTGTRGPLTEPQANALDETLNALVRNTPATLVPHHGDCVGADAAFHRLCRLKGLYVIGHPPLDEKLRAFCDVDQARPPLPYLDRNRAMVDEVDLLLAAPGTQEEVVRSGTWSTMRYARRHGVIVTVIFPDGQVQGAWHAQSERVGSTSTNQETK